MWAGITSLRNRHCINTMLICDIITSNSCDKFHVIWRIINFRSKFVKKILLRQSIKATQLKNNLFSVLKKMYCGWYQVISGIFWMVLGGLG